ncbi:hypothetical protein OIU74_007456 [Salix koriyanagi]|uniref:Uncharacterized protein n=1 Tax=Salix koriyanagi TaxID=2511006 RepID=A0A9Q0U3L6_9ROSI|nr:hypothetical protein OIU74_007456 [Salix koriyanagi]
MALPAKCVRSSNLIVQRHRPTSRQSSAVISVCISFTKCMFCSCYVPERALPSDLVTGRRDTAEEIDRLPKHKFCRVEDFEQVDGEIQEICGGMMTECGMNIFRIDGRQNVKVQRGVL